MPGPGTSPSAGGVHVGAGPTVGRPGCPSVGAAAPLGAAPEASGAAYQSAGPAALDQGAAGSRSDPVGPGYGGRFAFGAPNGSPTTDSGPSPPVGPGSGAVRPPPPAAARRACA